MGMLYIAVSAVPGRGVWMGVCKGVCENSKYTQMGTLQHNPMQTNKAVPSQVERASPRWGSHTPQPVPRTERSDHEPE